jgi:hypothetical protein
VNNSNQFEVLNPWAEVDPITLKGLSPRLSDLTGKKIGLYHNSKRAAEPTLAAIKARLKEKYRTLTFSTFLRIPNLAIYEMEEKPQFDEWVKELDAVIFAVAD